MVTLIREVGYHANSAEEESDLVLGSSVELNHGKVNSVPSVVMRFVVVPRSEFKSVDPANSPEQVERLLP